MRLIGGSFPDTAKYISWSNLNTAAFAAATNSPWFAANMNPRHSFLIDRNAGANVIVAFDNGWDNDLTINSFVMSNWSVGANVTAITAYFWATPGSSAATVSSITGSGTYTVNTSAAHGLSTGDRVRLVRADDTTDFTKQFFYATVTGGSAFTIEDETGITDSGTYYVYDMASQGTEDLLTGLADNGNGELNLHVNYFSSSYTADVVEIGFTYSSSALDFYAGRIKFGEYYEPRLQCEPQIMLTWDDKSTLSRQADGGFSGLRRTSHRVMSAGLNIDSAETGGASELTDLLYMLRTTGQHSDYFVDVNPTGTDTYDKDHRFLGVMTQKTGPVATGGQLNGALGYRFNFALDETT